MKMKNMGNGVISCLFTTEELKSMDIDNERLISDENYRLDMTLFLTKKCVMLAATHNKNVNHYTSMSYSADNGMRIDLYPCCMDPEKCPFHASGKCEGCKNGPVSGPDTEESDEDYDDEDGIGFYDDDPEYGLDDDMGEEGQTPRDGIVFTIVSDKARLEECGVDTIRLNKDQAYRDEITWEFLRSVVMTVLGTLAPAAQDGADSSSLVNKSGNRLYELRFRSPEEKWMTPEFSISIPVTDLEGLKVDTEKVNDDKTYASAALLYIASYIGDGVLNVFQEADALKQSGAVGYARKFVRFTGTGMETTFTIPLREGAEFPGNERMAIQVKTGTMDEACRICAVLEASGVPAHGQASMLYKQDGSYIIYAEFPEWMNGRAMGALSEHDVQSASQGLAEIIKAGLDEHCEVIVKENAVNKLSALA